MGGTVKLSTLISRVRDRAKMENSSFVSDPELKSLINDSIASLYDLIIQHRGEEYFESKKPVQLSNGSSEYDLPDDFYKLISVVDSNGYPLGTFDRRDANHRDGFLRYRISNNKLQTNHDGASQTLTLYYIPLAPELSGDDDTADFYNGWERYVIDDCAKALLEEEESDTRHLERALIRHEARIASSSPKDIARPERINDVEGSGNHGFREIY